jgi:hypothetical protein
MTLLSLLLTIAIFGFILWLIVTYIPMPPPFKQIIIVVAGNCDSTVGAQRIRRARND